MRKNCWKPIALLLCAAMLLSSLGGCAKEKQPDRDAVQPAGYKHTAGARGRGEHHH